MNLDFILLTGLTDNFYTLHETHSEECLPNSKNVFRQGFSFKVYFKNITLKCFILYIAMQLSTKSHGILLYYHIGFP